MHTGTEPPCLPQEYAIFNALNSSGTVVASTSNLVPTQAYNNQSTYKTDTLTSTSQDIVQVRINFTKTSNYGMKEFYVYSSSSTPITKYSITNTLSNCTSSNTNTEIDNDEVFSDEEYEKALAALNSSKNTRMKNTKN